MPRAATGSVRWRRGRAYARVTLGPGDRPEYLLATCSAGDEAKAAERARVLAELAQRLRAASQVEVAPRLLERAASRDGRALEDVLEAAERLCAGAAIAPRSARLTIKEFGEQWTKGELHRRWPDHVKLKKSVDDDRERLEKWVYPVVGDVPLVEFTLDHADRVMAELPPPPKLSPATRRHVAQVMNRLLNLAEYPARIIAKNPLPKGFLPSVGAPKALTHLYPDEDRTLLACTSIPLVHRLFYGYTAREGMRSGEAQRVAWNDLDLERGAIKLDKNKTDCPRSWALDPGVARALRAYRKLLGDVAGDELVFFDHEAGRVLGEDSKACVRFRKHLELAGITRPELFERSASRAPIRIHDLRATMITIALATGRTETWVADRTGHKSSAMINRYRRAARTVDELGLGGLAPLDEAIPELAPVLAEKGPEKGPAGSGGVNGGSAESGITPGFQVDSRGGSRTRTPLRIADFEALSPFANGSNMLELQGNQAPDATVRAGRTASSPFQTPSGPIPEGSPMDVLETLSAAFLRAARAHNVAGAEAMLDAMRRQLGVVAAPGEGAEVVSLAVVRRGEDGDR